MKRIVITGCGIIGAMVAYELSQIPGLNITVLDKAAPAQGSTGAALGVLMGAISHKTKGRAWQLREQSIRRYETLIPELEAKTGRKLLFNRQGILKLCFDETEIPGWEKLQQIRASQGWKLELWSPEELAQHAPHLDPKNIKLAIYSPCDRQLDPSGLTVALVAAAQQNGVEFRFGVEALGHQTDSCITTQAGDIAYDFLVICAGLGSFALTATFAQPIPLQPVLGQAIQIRFPQPLGNPEFQPAITGEDVHLVPLGNGDYWLGATVEFPNAEMAVTAEAAQLQAIQNIAHGYCPALKGAEILRTWSGLRPRPMGRPAPILEPMAEHPQIYLATGHYRNGVLLAPASAQGVKEWLELQL